MVALKTDEEARKYDTHSHSTSEVVNDCACLLLKAAGNLDCYAYLPTYRGSWTQRFAWQRKNLTSSIEYSVPAGITKIPSLSMVCFNGKRNRMGGPGYTRNVGKIRNSEYSQLDGKYHQLTLLRS